MAEPDIAAPVPEVQPPSLVEFHEKVRACLTVVLIIAFTAIVLVWTWHPPQLPGDSTGVVIGAFAGWVGSLIGGVRNRSTRGT